MSISSAIAAEYGEVKRKEWVAKLEAAYAARDWAAVEVLLSEIQRFYFSE